MEAPSGTPDGLILGQDEDTEIRVQPGTQGGSRHLDVRIWKRGPNGFTPTRDALVLDAADLEAMGQGIVELLEASDGGKGVARIVLDSGDGRRLRAETEPFGTRYVAHFSFWQRGRDSWHPNGDGIVLSADRLSPLQTILARYASWLGEPSAPGRQPVPPEVRQPIDDQWPAPGADWLTVEPNRVALHPRGIRITFAIEQRDGRHVLMVRQWRKEDTLWVPESEGLELSVADLESFLTCLRGFLDGDPEQARDEELSCSNGSHLRLHTGEESRLRVEYRPPNVKGEARAWLSVPVEHLPRLGRALAQSWSLLIGWLSDREREELQEKSEGPARIAEDRTDVPVPAPPVPEAQPPPRAVGPAIRFGEESAYPGAVIPQENQVRVVVEGYLLPRGITLPIDVVARVVSGLEELCALQMSQPRVAPMLMCDRPDCAVYGRVGTTTRPEAVEIRVWSSPRSSESITFDRIYLPALIEGLRHALRVHGRPEPLPSASFVATQRAMEHSAPPVAVSVSPQIPQVQPPPPPTPVHLGELRIENQRIQFDLEPGEQQILVIHWDGGVLRLRADELEDLLSKVRTLYYDTLRGRRGKPLLAGTSPSIQVSIHNQGASMHLQLRDASDQEGPALSFPAVQTSAFLNLARVLERREASEEE